MTEPIPGNGTPTEIDVLKAEVRSADFTAQKAAEMLNNAVQAAGETRAKIELSIISQGKVPDQFAGDVNDKNSDKAKAHTTRTAVIRTLLAVQEGKAPLPDLLPNGQPAPAELKQLAQSTLEKLSTSISLSNINEQNAPYLHHLIYRLVNGEINNVEGLVAEFNQLALLSQLSPSLYGELQQAMVMTAVENGWDAPRINREFGLERTGATAGMSEFQDRSWFWEKYPMEKDRKLISALASPKAFEEYVETEHKEFARQQKEPHHLSDKEVNAEFSTDLKRRITMLVGKLYQDVDESAPGEFVEMIEQKQGVYGITYLRTAFERKLSGIMHATFSQDSVVNKIQWHNEKQVVYDTLVSAEPKYKDVESGKGKFEVVKRRYTCFTEPKQVDFNEYFLGVVNSVATNIEAHRFLHNAGALSHQPPDEHGFYGRLEQYADQMMGQKSHDEALHLVDADKMLTASRLEDKFMEANFAKYNWIHQPTMETLDSETKLTPVETETLESLEKIYKDLYREDPQEARQRIRRALAMARGDNYSLSMRALELGAIADPPKNPDGTPNFASYTKRDAQMFKVFNQMGHENLRFSSESLLVGNLLFLPVEGKDLRQLSAWDHSKLRDYMKDGVNSFNSGKSADDWKNGRMRFIDWINPARVGSIYSRAGWRDFNSYEHHLVKPGGNLDVVKSWKAIENIGVEVMKDFITSPDTIATTNFYNKDDKVQENNRRELFTHIYRRYFDHQATNDTIKEKFAALEKNKDLAGSYKTFFFDTLARAIDQRIPTKFLRMETTKTVSGRERLWEIIRKNGGFTGDQGLVQYDTAIKDICIAETMLRDEITKAIQQATKQGKKMENIDLGNQYELTREKLNDYLKKLVGGDTERIGRALKVYDENKKYIKEKAYLEEFARTYQDDAKKTPFPFAIAVEELERSLLAHAASGDRTIARAIGEIAATEKNVAGSISKLLPTLVEASRDGKQNFSEIVKLIDTAKKMVESMHGPEAAHRLAHHMAALTVAFFKADAFSKPYGGIFGTNKLNSLAAEFAGRGQTVWEWDSRTIDLFCTALESWHILPVHPYELQKTPTYEPWPVKIKLPLIKEIEFNLPDHLTIPNKIKIGGKEKQLFKKAIKIPLPFRRRKADYKWWSEQLRQEYGGDARAVIFDMINRYIPIALVILLAFWIQKAFKEAFGKKK
ncbi:hypothetical protein M1523_02580 [Patescibacteria group bacterium]|nr:hypothetical protein [Patescibacteria group bacterium]MCL5091393.1 hypothetical protein [Patescibacteria group bacterium]